MQRSLLVLLLRQYCLLLKLNFPLNFLELSFDCGLISYQKNREKHLLKEMLKGAKDPILWDSSCLHKLLMNYNIKGRVLNYLNEDLIKKT